MMCLQCESYFCNKSSIPKRERKKLVKPGEQYCFHDKPRKIKISETRIYGIPSWCPIDPIKKTCIVCGTPIRGDDELCKSCKRKGL